MKASDKNLIIPRQNSQYFDALMILSREKSIFSSKKSTIEDFFINIYIVEIISNNSINEMRIMYLLTVLREFLIKLP